MGWGGGVFCGGLEDCGGAVEGLGERGELGLGAGTVGGFDAFVDAGDDDSGVAGELAGGVDGVLEPGAPGQAGWIEEGLFGCAEGLVEGGGIRGWGALGGADGSAGGGEAFGGGEGGGEVEGQLLLGGAFLRGFEVADDLFAVELVVVGEDVGVGHVEDFEAEDAGLLLFVDEGGVGKFGEPGVVVEGGVVDAVGAVGADVGGGDAEVLDEGGVVGAGAEGADANVGVVSGGVLAAATGVGLLFGLPLVVDGAAFGAGDFFGDLADELLERGDGRGVEVGAGDADVGVEVGNGVGEDFFVLLGPLG